MKREGSAEAAPAKRIKTTHFSTDLHPAQGRLAEYAAATGDALTEKDVAIECYVDETVPPIAGILKHRSILPFRPTGDQTDTFACSFLDFLVNEVTKDGTVIRLTDIAKPIEVEEEKPAVEQQVEMPKPAQVRSFLSTSASVTSHRRGQRTPRPGWKVYLPSRGLVTSKRSSKRDRLRRKPSRNLDRIRRRAAIRYSQRSALSLFATR